MSQLITCQKHNTCKNNAFCKGVAAVIFNNYYGKQYVVLLGKERKGQYEKQYNLCAGKVEAQDNGCLLNALKRELSEEFKINCFDWKDFDNIFKGSNGIRCYTTWKTLVFVGIVKGISRKTLNAEISKCNNDPTLPWCQKEINDVEWFDVNTLKQIENKECEISSFANSQIAKAFEKI